MGSAIIRCSITTSSSCDSTCDHSDSCVYFSAGSPTAAVKEACMNRQLHEVYMYTPLTCGKPSKLAQSACFQRDSSIRSRARCPIQRFDDAAGHITVEMLDSITNQSLYVCALSQRAGSVFYVFWLVWIEFGREKISCDSHFETVGPTAQKTAIGCCCEKSSFVRWAVRFARVELRAYPTSRREP